MEKTDETPSTSEEVIFGPQPLVASSSDDELPCFDDPDETTGTIEVRSEEVLLQQDISHTSDDELELTVHCYNPYTTTSATTVQRQDFFRELEQMKLKELAAEKSKKSAKSKKSQQREKANENPDKLNVTAKITEQEVKGFVTDEAKSEVSNAGGSNERKKSFFSKFGLHWGSRNSGRGGRNSGSGSSSRTSGLDTSNALVISRIMGGFGSGDKKTGVHRVKDDEIALWGGSPVDRMIGDFSKPHALPVIMGLHPDLKSITPNVLMRLFKGLYEDEIESFRLLDCRYPYEYEGGHIRSALNIYTREQIAYLLSGKAKDFDGKRNILVFYCEFSSERAPSLCRYLREEDRKLNKAFYPKLNYPEIYLMAGGYKKFFADYPMWCIPQDYKPMLHPDHAHELHYFRIKLKNLHAYAKSKDENSQQENANSQFYNELGLQN